MEDISTNHESLNDGGDCRTAPATPGLLIITDGDTCEDSEKDDSDDTNLAEVEEEGDKRDDRAGSVGGGELVMEGGEGGGTKKSCTEYI